jgi:hypothetical protein
MNCITYLFANDCVFYVFIQEITDFFLRTLTQINAYEPPMSPPSSNVTYTVPVLQSSRTTASDDHIQHSAAMTNSSTTTGTDAAANSATATAGTNSRVGDAAMLQQQPTTAAAAAYTTDTLTEVPLKGQEQTGAQSVELDVARHLIVPPAVRYFVHQAEEWHACDSFAVMPSQRCDMTVTLAPAGVLAVSTSSTATATAVAQTSSDNSGEQQQHSATDITAKPHGANSSSSGNGATESSFESVQQGHDGQSSAGVDTNQRATTAAADTVLDTTATDADRDITATDNKTRNSTATATAAVSDVHLNGVQSTAVISDNAASAVAAVRGYDELLVNVLKDRDGAGNSRWAAMTKASYHFQI